MVESGSEVPCFIPEPRNFEEVSRLTVYVKKDWLKSTFKYINILIINQTLLMDETEKRDPLKPRMDVYTAEIQYDGILDKLKLRIVVRV